MKKNTVLISRCYLQIDKHHLRENINSNINNNSNNNYIFNANNYAVHL